MRATYSAGMVDVLLEEGLYFNMVAGVSAGCTLLVNYMTRDRRRLWQSFIGLAEASQLGGMKTFLKGQGYFNAAYIYGPENFAALGLEFQLDRWLANPGQVAIGAYNASKDRMTYWHKEELQTTADISRACRASSTLPGAMPDTYIRGDLYLDGGLKESIPLSPAQAMGYRKFFVIATQPRGYRKKEVGPWADFCYPKQPHIRRAIKARPEAYNARLEDMAALEREGRLLWVTPDEVLASRGEMRPDVLQAAFEAGRAQAKRDLAAWKAFLLGDQDSV